MVAVEILGEPAEIVGSSADTYFSSIAPGTDVADSVIKGVLPFVPSEGVCIDVGANLGLYSIALSRRYPDLTVYSLEPVPETFRFLEANVSRNAPGCKSLQLACGASDETAHMQFVEHFAAGSHFSVKESLANVENTGDSVVEVSVRTLDSLVGELGLDRLDVLKIDVEGFELDVLRGARAVLSRFRPITQIEFNSWTFLSHRMTLPQECLDEILAIFPFVYVHARFDERLARLSTQVDRHSLLYANVTQGTVDNLMCSFTDIAPDAPPFAEVWPDFVQSVDVRENEIHEHVRAIESRVEAQKLEIAASKRNVITCVRIRRGWKR